MTARQANRPSDALQPRPDEISTPTTLTATVPLRIRSTANLRLHWAEKARLVKRQREAGYLAAKLAHPSGPWMLGIGPTIRLIRIIGPRGRELDSDNLPAAFKAFRDGVADALRVDDGAKASTLWEYAEEPGRNWAVRIEISGAWQAISGRTE